MLLLFTLGGLRCSDSAEKQHSIEHSTIQWPPVCGETAHKQGCRKQRPDGSWFRLGGSDHDAYQESHRDYAPLMHALMQPGLVADWQNILDAGANEGTSTHIFATAHPRARVIAVEPSRETLAMPHLNLMNTSNVELIHGALWTHNTNIEIASASRWGAWAAHVKVRGAGNERVRGITVPKLMHQSCVGSFDFVKVCVRAVLANPLT